jgi:hypothetical protein
MRSPRRPRRSLPTARSPAKASKSPGEDMPQCRQGSALVALSRFLSRRLRGDGRAVAWVHDHAGRKACTFSRLLPSLLVFLVLMKVQTQCSHGCTSVEWLYMQASTSYEQP